jgi:outer membrane cobalamin receptor
VVVTATRSPLLRSRVAAPVTVFTQENIQRSPFQYGYQTDELSRYVPAVQPSLLSSHYSHPMAQAVGVRSLGVRRALVLLNGVPLDNGIGGWINWGPNRIAWSGSRSSPAADRTSMAPEP